MEVAIVVIGDELLIGQVVDTNSGDIARMIAPAGWTVKYVESVHDDSSAIKGAVERGMESADIVLMTGGLGPTKDDITKETLREIFGGGMVLDSGVLEHVRSVFQRRGLNMNALTESQAMVPDSCTVIRNELGTAPVMWFEKEGKVVVAMPGVPFETRHAFRNEVLPRLLSRFGQRSAIGHRTLVVTDITESDLAENLEQWESSLPEHLHLAYLPQAGYIRLRLDGIGDDSLMVDRDLDNAVSWLQDWLGDKVLATADLTPEQVLADELRRRGLTFATAESCTGGNVVHRLTLLPGISDVLCGSVVSYSNEVKHNVLGVDNETLSRLGAVSEPVARMMAEGVRKALGAGCAISTSGIAGPGGATPDKPVGTVCMAFSTPQATRSATFRFPGDRQRVIDRASTVALIEMVKLLRQS
ncbi:MAG: CinA family nicotinamide mononucleotide deamidase-related protein [Muribaculaceae bacterium]|nr:CinA family nicotinamide mononucleotide deamidase-related protein [Muribaculaceae bacterium]